LADKGKCMKVGDCIICAGTEDMLSEIAALRSEGYKTRQTDEAFTLLITEKGEPNWMEDEINDGK